MKSHATEDTFASSLKSFCRRSLRSALKVPRIAKLLRSVSWEIEQSRSDSFYSSIPSKADLQFSQQRAAQTKSKEVPGIDLQESQQMLLLEELRSYYQEHPWSATRTDNCRFYFENDSYSYSESIFLYCMMRHLRPARIVEIGAGFSTMAILDVREKFLDEQLHLVCIEPNPGRLMTMLTDKTEALNKFDLLIKRVQDVDPAYFARLQANDVLFIDSSHVLKTGSDVNYLLLEILPRLQKGVYIHFHDICYPFEYPKRWVQSKRAWNEAYALQAFLTFNHAFEIVLFTNYIHSFHSQWLAANMPLCERYEGGSSIWLTKVQ